LANAFVVVVSHWSLCTAAAALTPTPAPPTPTPTACETFPPPKLGFQFSSQPAHPVVGDLVVLTFTVSGRGGIPAYSLSCTAPVFQGDTSVVDGGPLGDVTFHMLAVQPGTSTLTLSVDYETALGCVDQPFYQFVYDTSPPFMVQVTGGPTPTATATPTPGACLGDCDGSGAVTVDELVLGVNMVLGSVGVTACPSFACTEDPGVVVVNCIIVAVNNALSGCRVSFTPTPTPTRPCPTPQPTLTDLPCGAGCAGSCQTLGTTGFCQSLDRACTCVPFFPTLTPTIPCG